MYQAFFKIKELVSLAIFQLESSDSEDHKFALMNLERAATLAADSSREAHQLMPPADDLSSRSRPVTPASYGLLLGDALSVVRTSSLERVVKASAESTGGMLSAWESTFQAGAASPLHVHHDAAEFFFVLEGDVSLYLNGDWFEAKPGAFAAVPKGAPHGFRVRSSETRILFMFSPAAMLGLWEEMAALGRPADEAAFAALARKYQMEVLGPLPEA